MFQVHVSRILWHTTQTYCIPHRHMVQCQVHPSLPYLWQLSFNSAVMLARTLDIKYTVTCEQNFSCTTRTAIWGLFSAENRMFHKKHRTIALQTFAITSILLKTVTNQHLHMNCFHLTTKILLQMMKNQIWAKRVAGVNAFFGNL